MRCLLIRENNSKYCLKLNMLQRKFSIVSVTQGMGIITYHDFTLLRFLYLDYFSDCF